MSENTSQSLLNRRLRQKGIRKPVLEKIAGEAGLWDGKEKVTIAILTERLCEPANFGKVWPYRDLLPDLPSDPARLQALRDALDTSTRVNRALGLSFVGFMFYILTIVASTSDLMIFLPESKVRLPIVDVELPLIGFYLIVPFVILTFHFNLLINLKHHQDKYRAWKEEAKPEVGDTNLLDPILINFLDSYPSKHVFRLLLFALIAGSLFYFPLANIIYMMGRFADYHDFGYSCLQALAVAADAALCFVFFHRIFLLEGKGWWRWLRLEHWLSGCMLFLALWQWSMTLCLYGRLDNPQYMAWLYDTADLPRIDLTNQVHLVGEVADGYVMHYLRDSADVDYANRRAYRGFGKRLILEGRDFRYAVLDGINLVGANMKGCQMDSVSMKAADVSQAQMNRVRMRGANLESLRAERVVLDSAHLEGADLWEAHLEGADLQYAHLEKAALRKAHLEGADLWEAHLEGADLRKAHLERADAFKIDRFVIETDADRENATSHGAHLEAAVLQEAHLEGADLNFAHLEGADLKKAHLEDVNLSYAHLEDADLQEAHLEAANLLGAHLEKADMRSACLAGANLGFAHMEGVDLWDAQLEGADLSYARLEGADLRAAQLEGADLSYAHLEAAVLRYAHLEGAVLQFAHLQNADLNHAHLEGACLVGAHLEGAILPVPHPEGAALFGCPP